MSLCGGNSHKNYEDKWSEMLHDRLVCVIEADRIQLAVVRPGCDLWQDTEVGPGHWESQWECERWTVTEVRTLICEVISSSGSEQQTCPKCGKTGLVQKVCKHSAFTSNTRGGTTRKCAWDYVSQGEEENDKIDTVEAMFSSRWTRHTSHLTVNGAGMQFKVDSGWG